MSKLIIRPSTATDLPTRFYSHGLTIGSIVTALQCLKCRKNYMTRQVDPVKQVIRMKKGEDSQKNDAMIVSDSMMEVLKRTEGKEYQQVFE